LRKSLRVRKIGPQRILIRFEVASVSTKQVIAEFVEAELGISLSTDGGNQNRVLYGSKEVFNKSGIPMVMNVLVGHYFVELNSIIDGKLVRIEYANPKFFEILRRHTI
jgi:hypothetical protein